MDYKRKLYEIGNDRIHQVDFTEITRLKDSKSDYLLVIKAGSREPVSKELKDLGFDTTILSEIKNPENSKNILISGHSLLINLVIPKTSAWYERDYITFLIKQGLMVAILNTWNSLFDGLEEEFNLIPQVEKFNVSILIYYLINIILKYSTECVIRARELTDKLSDEIDNSPESIDQAQIIGAKNKGQGLANIIEDQHITLRLVPRLNWSGEASNINEEIRNIIDHFRFLSIMIDRLEEKIRGLHLQYQLILQEKGNKRLNALTIIQAIFVPLTLIAGIYGMNFIFMPELKWTYGYFWVLGFMLLIALGELAWFYRKKWFD